MDLAVGMPDGPGKGEFHAWLKLGARRARNSHDVAAPPIQLSNPGPLLGFGIKAPHRGFLLIDVDVAASATPMAFGGVGPFLSFGLFLNFPRGMVIGVELVVGLSITSLGRVECSPHGE